MSESNEHIRLVAEAEKIIRQKFPKIKIISDIQETPGDPAPPLIGGHRPDIYGTDFSENARIAYLITEAKTVSDLHRPRTEAQIASFIEHVEQQGRGLFLLSVLGTASGSAKSILRFMHEMGLVTHTRLVVFDSLDLWYFNGESKKWHLG